MSIANEDHAASGTLYGFRREDIDAMAKELVELRRSLRKTRTKDDFRHLKKLERWGRTCTALGYGTGWMAPNLFSASMMALGKTSRWACVLHPISHRGYDTVPDIPDRYTSKHFAKGWRRYIDWFDWITPEGWHQEHDVLHHYRLGEDRDPDNIQNNFSFLRDSDLPMPVRYAITALIAATWKYTYYAPTTLTEDQQTRLDPDAPKLRVATPELFDPRTERGREMWLRCYLPYATFNFVLLPMLVAPLGPWASASMWMNAVMAEAIHCVHSFIIIAPSHTGDDIPTFENKPEGRAEFFLHQILGSANYTTGGDFNDFLHGWLNYQIEHHLFPNLSLLEYQKIQPGVQAICEKYGVPYRQDSVWKRAKKTLDVMVGKADQLGAMER